MQLELENARDKWKLQCDEEVARRLAGKEEELVKKMEDKEDTWDQNMHQEKKN